MASSRPIVAGEDYTPDDINNLRSDVLDPVSGHMHNGTDGAKVPFSNLNVAGAYGSTDPTGGTKSYIDIVNHIDANNGAHGSPSVGGAMTGNITGLTGGMMLHGGVGVLSTNEGQVYFDVTFDYPYSSPSVIVLTTYPAGAVNITASGFRAQAGNFAAGATVYWLAFGKKT